MSRKNYLGYKYLDEEMKSDAKKIIESGWLLTYYQCLHAAELISYYRKHHDKNGFRTLWDYHYDAGDFQFTRRHALNINELAEDLEKEGNSLIDAMSIIYRGRLTKYVRKRYEKRSRIREGKPVSYGAWIRNKPR